jgi:hypothetical protein
VVPTGGFTVTSIVGVAPPLQTVATFTDPAGAEALADYSAQINWGDNTTPSPGVISFDPDTGVFTVQGSHAYAQAGSDTVTVTIHHDAAPDVTTISTAQVDASAAFNRFGTFSLIATDTANPSLSGTQADIQVVNENGDGNSPSSSSGAAGPDVAAASASPGSAAVRPAAVATRAGDKAREALLDAALAEASPLVPQKAMDRLTRDGLLNDLALGRLA